MICLNHRQPNLQQSQAVSMGHDAPPCLTPEIGRSQGRNLNSLVSAVRRFAIRGV